MTPHINLMQRLWNFRILSLIAPWSDRAPENEMCCSINQACRARSIGLTVVFSCPRTWSAKLKKLGSSAWKKKSVASADDQKDAPMSKPPGKKRLYMVEKARRCAVNADLWDPQVSLPLFLRFRGHRAWITRFHIRLTVSSITSSQFWAPFSFFSHNSRSTTGITESGSSVCILKAQQHGIVVLSLGFVLWIVSFTEHSQVREFRKSCQSVALSSSDDTMTKKWGNWTANDSDCCFTSMI